MTKHGASIPGTGLGSRANRFLIRGAAVVAVSRESMAILKAWKTDNRPVRYIPNGISVEPYQNLPTQAEARAELDLPAESFVIGIVARVTAIKGHTLLIDVFARLLRKIPNALLLIVGNGVALPGVKAHIRNSASKIPLSRWESGKTCQPFWQRLTFFACLRKRRECR